MRLSKKTEYALRALIYAAGFPQGTTFQIKDLAGKNDIPKKFLELILLELKNAGILSSRRGVGGGYILARRPETIRASEIIRAIEGPPAAPTESRRPGRRGEPASDAVSRLVRETSEAMDAVLSRWTLADLAREEKDAAERKRRNVMYFI
ncbi:MAG: RrF2 family transcriptional regulator [Gemmatimonadota bacterium]